LSEEEKYEVWIDPDPELWDSTLDRIPEVKKEIEFAEKNYIRKGSCVRCGKCCYWRDKDGSLKPCKYLVFVDDVPTCSVYGTDKMPNRCKNFPPKPTQNVEYYEGNYLLPKGETETTTTGCGYYWIWK